MTFTDEAQAHSKKIPAPTAYNPKVEPRILYGKVNKCEGLDYLSDCTYMGKCFPGPGTYKANHDYVAPTARKARIHPLTKDNRGWKPVKSKAPDCATYDIAKAKDKIGLKVSTQFFSRPGAGRNTEKTTFTTEICKLKKFVPGAGTYKPEYRCVTAQYTNRRC